MPIEYPLSAITDTPIPFNFNAKYIILPIMFILTVIGAALETIVIIAIIVDARQAKGMSVDTKFILSLCLADYIFSWYNVLANPIKMAYGAYTFGKYGCIVESGIILSTYAISILSLLAITVNRYLLLMKRIDISDRMANTVVCSIWIGTVILLIIMLSIGLEIGLLWENYYCMIDFTTTNHIARAGAIILITCIILPFFFMSFAYHSIIAFYLESNRRREQGNMQLIVEEKERRLIVKCASITASYVLCMLPFLVKIFYELTTHRSVPVIPDMIIHVIMVLNPIMNAIMLLVFDYKIKGTVFQMFGMEKLSSSHNVQNEITESCTNMFDTSFRAQLGALNVGGGPHNTLAEISDSSEQVKRLSPVYFTVKNDNQDETGDTKSQVQQNSQT